ncbi:MAG: hypothetical protein ABL959_20730 [Pyrinomonadaceae bacterium]
MRSIRIIAAAALLLSFTTFSFGQLGLSTKQITFKKDVFEQNLTSTLSPQMLGYQYVLIKDGKIVSEVAGGNARVGQNGLMKMTPTTPINIGSLFKFISGTTMLNLFETKPQKMESTYKIADSRRILTRRSGARCRPCGSVSFQNRAPDRPSSATSLIVSSCSTVRVLTMTGTRVRKAAVISSTI